MNISQKKVLVRLQNNFRYYAILAGVYSIIITGVLILGHLIVYAVEAAVL